MKFDKKERMILAAVEPTETLRSQPEPRTTVTEGEFLLTHLQHKEGIYTMGYNYRGEVVSFFRI